MTRLAPLAGIALLAIGGMSVQGVGPAINPPGQTPDYNTLNAGDSHASASLLGQFRTSVSAWLWLRSDLYLHNGVEMRPMTDTEVNHGVTTMDAADDGNKKLLDESSVLTIIPPKDRDFRGVFGDVERATNAYKDMHNHTHNDPIAALPLFRLMTWIDPSFIPGWVVGGSIIVREKSKSAAIKGVEYLKQGLQENKNNIQILKEIGEMYITRLHMLPKAIGYLEQAREVGRHRENIVAPMELEALEQSYRWLGLCYRDLNQQEKMRDVAKEGLKLFNDDVILEKLLVTPPMIFTMSYQATWLQHQLNPVANDAKPHTIE